MGDACHPFRLWVGFDEPQCFGFRIRCNRDVVDTVAESLQINGGSFSC